MEGNSEINVKFVSQKVSKVRWRPRAKQSIQPSDIFASGSWDDDVSIIFLRDKRG